VQERFDSHIYGKGHFLKVRLLAILAYTKVLVQGLIAVRRSIIWDSSFVGTACENGEWKIR